MVGSLQIQGIITTCKPKTDWSWGIFYVDFTFSKKKRSGKNIWSRVVASGCCHLFKKKICKLLTPQLFWVAILGLCRQPAAFFQFFCGNPSVPRFLEVCRMSQLRFVTESTKQSLFDQSQGTVKKRGQRSEESSVFQNTVSRSHKHTYTSTTHKQYTPHTIPHLLLSFFLAWASFHVTCRRRCIYDKPTFTSAFDSSIWSHQINTFHQINEKRWPSFRTEIP